jgi:hypothetical protein
MGEKIAYTMRIDKDIYSKAQIVAAELRSVNNLIEYLLMQKIKEYDQSQGSENGKLKYDKSDLANLR